jgi:hypothetical protein
MSLATVTKINQGAKSMPSKNGYVHLWRDIKKQPFYKDFIERGMFMDMLLDAQHTSKAIQIDGVNIFLTTGQLFTKRKHFVDQGINDSKVERTLSKFEKLGIISRETIKLGKRSIGQKITFFNWQKWQKTEQSTDQPTEQPQPTNIKGLNGYAEQSTEQSTEQECNNDSNKRDIKEYDVQARRLLIENAFEHVWKKWKSCKASVGKTDTSAKSATLTKKFKPMFNTSYFAKHTEAEFKSEINAICKFMDSAHKVEGFNRFHNMQLAKFFTEKQWRD